MRRFVATVVMCAALALAASPALAQKKKSTTTAKKAAPKAAAVPPKTATPDIKCPSLIGMGVKTVRSFCDVPAGRDPQQGIIITLPAHTGPGTLTFDLHARHLYSEDEMKSGRVYSRYRVVIGALTLKGDLLGRGAIEAEFRTAADLFDRIGGGNGPGGVKAVAPAGREPVIVEVPAGVDEVALLGETLDAITPAGHETAVMPGRPVAIVSNVLFEYRPAPQSHPRGFAPRTPRHALSRAASPARSVRVANSLRSFAPRELQLPPVCSTHPAQAACVNRREDRLADRPWLYTRDAAGEPNGPPTCSRTAPVALAVL